MALNIGATFVARSFSGDKRQLVPLIKAGLLHKGFAFIDVISPCVAFNNHDGSTKSYDYVRDHQDNVVSADFVAPHAEVTADYAPGAREDVKMPDGSTLQLRKLHDDYDPRDRVKASRFVQEKALLGEVVTGLLYIDPDASDTHDILGTVDAPLSALGEAELCPGNAALASINAGLR
jgi:2-oxoglutarate ferredoxin oxidoreductase subunit beta